LYSYSELNLEISEAMAINKNIKPIIPNIKVENHKNPEIFARNLQNFSEVIFNIS
jgi:hypothetical protein